MVLNSIPMKPFTSKVCQRTKLLIALFFRLLNKFLSVMWRSGFRENEASKMVISRFSLESEMLHHFQVNFFNVIGIAIFNVI